MSVLSLLKYEGERRRRMLESGIGGHIARELRRQKERLEQDAIAAERTENRIAEFERQMTLENAMRRQGLLDSVLAPRVEQQPELPVEPRKPIGFR